MFALRLISAAGCLSTLISGAPIPSIPSSAAMHASNLLTERSANKYTVFGGTGLESDGWPAVSSWIATFDEMFESNQGVMKDSCTQFSVPANTDDEVAQMKSAISSVAASSGIDARFILAIVMQESNGCIRAPTTNYGVRNPGLMQSHNGAGTCNDGSVQTPCPEAQILQMIKDGTLGTSSGDGLAQCLKQAGTSDVSMYYKAARIYNSGSIDSSKNLGAGIATHCYSTDIANRLTGWFSGTSSCDPATIATISGKATAVNVDVAPLVAAAEPVTTKAAAVVGGGVFAEKPSTTTQTPLPTTTTATLSEVTPEPTPVAPTPSPIVVAEPVAEPVPVTKSVLPIPAAKPTPASTPAAESSPVAEPTATATPEVVAPAPEVAPTPAPTPEVAAPAPTPEVAPPTSTPAPAPAPAAGAITAGTPCPTEGLWNCISGASFQQCASGTWSAVQSLAAGMECASGQSMVFTTNAIVARS